MNTLNLVEDIFKKRAAPLTPFDKKVVLYLQKKGLVALLVKENEKRHL